MLAGQAPFPIAADDRLAWLKPEDVDRIDAADDVRLMDGSAFKSALT